ncbi:MAG: 30S ribosomal protein S4 [Promethearchaeota archaeon]
MGDPRRLRKKFKRPTTPWDKSRIDSELKILGDYGLRNKKELYKHQYQLRRYRTLARDLRTAPKERQEKEFTELVGGLTHLGLVEQNATTDDVLGLNVEDVLNRRLQTIVFKKGLGRSLSQSRQLIVHKHIAIKNKVIASPSYLVHKNEEENINFNDFSPFHKEPAKLLPSQNSGKKGNKGKTR